MSQSFFFGSALGSALGFGGGGGGGAAARPLAGCKDDAPERDDVDEPVDEPVDEDADEEEDDDGEIDDDGVPALGAVAPNDVAEGG